jgi:hypothetical protein
MGRLEVKESDDIERQASAVLREVEGKDNI